MVFGPVPPIGVWGREEFAVPDVVIGRFDGQGPEQDTLGAFLDAMDAADRELTGEPGGYVRFRRAAVPGVVRHPGGSVAAIKLVTRALSRERLKVVHASYLHPESACTVRIRTIDGEVRTAPGVIESCVYAGGRWHEAVMRFALPLPAAALETATEGATEGEADSVAEVKLRGSLLVISGDDEERERAGADIRGHGMWVVEAKCLGEGLETLQHHPFDAVAADLEVPELDPARVVRSIRTTEYRRVIVGMATDPGSIDTGAMEGETRVIGKPYRESELVGVLREYVGGERGRGSKERDLPWPRRA